MFDCKQRKIFTAVEKSYNIGDFDVIHAYTLFTDGNCARLLSEKYDIPYVVAVRNTDVNAFFRLRPHLRMRGVKTMLKASAVFFLSESYRNQVFDKYIPDKYRDALLKKSHIIPNGIDDFWLNNVPKCPNQIDDTIKLIYAGRIDRNKNISTTQKAVALLREKGYKVTFTVVGKVADKKIYNKIKKDLYTECLPAQSKQSLLEIYRKHDIFVMPSFTESFGLVYAEAMSQGLPVVYSKGQGFDNQFSEGKVGYHVYAHDAQNVSDAIEKIIQNFDSIVPSTIVSARDFNWTQITAKYNDIYRMLLEGNGG